MSAEWVVGQMSPTRMEYYFNNVYEMGTQMANDADGFIQR